MAQETDNVMGLKIGDILYCSWGYDQTNINFYRIIGLTPKKVRIVPIEAHVTETGFMSGNSTPGDEIKDWDSFVKDPVKGKLCTVKEGYRGDPTVVLESGYYYAWKYDGTPKYTSWYA